MGDFRERKPRQLGKDFAFCGFDTIPVGTPDMIADVIEEWINVADIDGFIVSCTFTYFPSSDRQEIVQVLRGLAYNPGALAIHLYRKRKHLKSMNTVLNANFIDVSNLGTYDDFVELLVPVLQERDVMWKDYAVPGGMFRENSRRKPGDEKLGSNHHAAQIRYGVLKQKYADEKGDIVIDRKKEAEEQTLLVKKTNGVKIVT